MTPPDQTSPEKQSTPSTQPEQQPASPEQVEAATRGQTRADLGKIREEIEQGHSKLEELKKKAASLTSGAIEWTNNQVEELNFIEKGAFDATIDPMIDKELDEKTLATLAEIGLNDETSINSIKALAKEIIKEHYTKTGKDSSKTAEYMKGEFKENLKSVAENLKSFYEANKDKIPNPQQALEMMGEFTGIMLFKNGKINGPELKRLLYLKRENLDQLVEGFKEYFTLQQTVESLTTQETSTYSEETPIEQIVTTTRLKQRIRITVTNLSTQKEEIINQIKAQLPDNLKPEIKEKYATWAFEQLEQKNPAAAEIRDLSPDGQWSDPITPEQIKTEAEASNQTQGTETPSENSAADYKTGIGFIDTILGAIKAFAPGFHKTIVDILKNMSFGGEEEFPKLSTSEKNNAKSFKSEAKKIGLNLDTLKNLFTDPDNFKKVLKKQIEEKIPWSEYLKKHLTASQTEQLKNKPSTDTDSGEKIAKMLLSENPDYQPPTEETPQPA